MDEKNYTVTVNGNIILWVHDWVDWDSQWNWGDFGKDAGIKIEKMINYLEEIN